MLYNLDEITLIPESISKINSRSECDVTYNNGKLPIFVSPMSCIINETNIDKFLNFNVIVPRTISWKTRLEYIKKGYWVAVGLEESQLNELYITLCECKHSYICIDQANGHMRFLLDQCMFLKKNFNVTLMTGNIANPETYVEYAKCGIDYVRVSIGTGNACTTSCQTGFHYPMGSLLIDINNKKKELIQKYKKYSKHNDLFTIPKIIADGGMRNNSQIIKALALGADYVMLGKTIAKMKESCGKVFKEYEKGSVIYKREYYGMSTEYAQILIANNSGINKSLNLKRAEGIIDKIPIEYNLIEWVKAFIQDLRSAMSYNNSIDITNFIGNVKWDIISENSYNKFMVKS